MLYNNEEPNYPVIFKTPVTGQEFGHSSHEPQSCLKSKTLC